METHLFSYSHEGKRWEMEIKANNAMTHVSASANSPTPHMMGY